MFFDIHVHCRDGRQSYKETIEHALYVAEKANYSALFDMAYNADPPTTRMQVAMDRIDAAKSCESPVYYGVYMGITKDDAQIAEAVRAVNEIPEVIGIKFCVDHTTGDCGITELADQRHVYKRLVIEGYDGVLAEHCEKKSRRRPELWNPQNPASHAYARPPESEVESVRDQIMLAGEEGFKGTVHVAHISVPEAVDLVNDARKYIKITCAATPHHIRFNQDRMMLDDGLQFKMNPSLRPEEMRCGILNDLKSGRINCVETDHAYHRLNEKINEPYLSGIPVMHYMPRFAEFLRSEEFSEERIEDATFNNPKKIFGKKAEHIKKRETDLTTGLDGFSLGYEFDPFRGI